MRKRSGETLRRPSAHPGKQIVAWPSEFRPSEFRPPEFTPSEFRPPELMPLQRGCMPVGAAASPPRVRAWRLRGILTSLVGSGALFLVHPSLQAAEHPSQALERLTRESPGLRHALTPTGGLRRLSRFKAGPYAGSPSRIAEQFLHEYGALLPAPLEELRVSRVLPLNLLSTAEKGELAPKSRRADPGGPLTHDQAPSALLTPDFDGSSDRLGDSGAVVRIVQMRQKVPFDQTGLVLRLSASGEVIGLTQRLAPAGPVQWPELTPAQALTRARELLPTRITTQPLPPPTLVYHLGPEGRLADHPTPVLTWRVFVPPVSPGAEVLRVHLDARSGALIQVEDLRQFEDPPALPTAPGAYIYPHNPYVDNYETTPVPLGEAAQTGLATDLFILRPCVDRQQTEEASDVDGKTWTIHICTEEDAAGPVDGNYYYAPEPTPADPARDEDGFSSPALFYHLNNILPWFTGLGLEAYNQTAIHVSPNLRYPYALDADVLQDVEAPLAVLNNAFFSPYYSSEGDSVPAALVFGQGTVSDFSYDADVVYHEFTHSVVNSLEGPQYIMLDSQGGSVEASAVNEGLADYFSSAYLEDPVVGEYAGLRWAPDGGGIRDLEIDARCPDFLLGESHNDSQPFSGALWDIRQDTSILNARQLDKLVLSALTQMDETSSISEASQLVLDEIYNSEGNEAANEASAWMNARGILNCSRQRPVAINGLDSPVADYAAIMGRGLWGATTGIPGNLQLKVTVPEGRHVLVVRFLQPVYNGIKLPSYGLDAEIRNIDVVRRFKDAISYSYERTSAGLSVNAAFSDLIRAEALDEEPQTSTSNTYYPFEARLLIEDQPGDHYLAFINWSQGSANLYNIALALEDAPAEPTPIPTHEGDGCGGCNSVHGNSAHGTSRSPIPAAMTLLLSAVLGLWLRRRRF